MARWDVAFEANPPGTGRSPSFGDNDIREFKGAVRERMAREHVFTTGSGLLPTHGYHLPGSAVIYYSSLAPTVLPDGTALGNDTNSKGRVFFDSVKRIVKVWGGTSFVGMTPEITRISLQGTLATGQAVVPPIIFSRDVGIVRVAARVLSAPTGASIKVDLEKNGTLSIFKTTFPMSIAAGSKSVLRTAGQMSNGFTSISANSWLEFDVDQVGSTLPGSNLALVIEVSLR